MDDMTQAAALATKPPEIAVALADLVPEKNPPARDIALAAFRLARGRRRR